MRERNEVIGFLRCFLFSNGLTNLYFLLRTERMLKVKIWLMSPAIIASCESCFKTVSASLFDVSFPFRVPHLQVQKERKKDVTFMSEHAVQDARGLFFQSTHIRINMCGNQ